MPDPDALEGNELPATAGLVAHRPLEGTILQLLRAFARIQISTALGKEETDRSVIRDPSLVCRDGPICKVSVASA